VLAAAGCVVTAAVLAACSAPSGATLTSPTDGSGPVSGTPLPSTTATAAPTTAVPPPTTRRTSSGDPGGTRTVYAGPSRTSTLVPWDEPSVRAGAGGPTPSAPAGSANLTILLDDGFGIRATWTLTCDPPGGSHPHPKVACGVLGANGATALAPAKGTCDEPYGGPQKALVTGTWRGRTVRSQFTLENGCEIARWTDMIGLLPPGGV
jgi:hypothetical protein